MLREPKRSARKPKHHLPKEYQNEKEQLALADSRVRSRRIFGRCTTAGPCGVSRHVPCGCWRGSVVRDDLKHIGVESYWCKMHSDDSLRRATELDDRTLIGRPTSPRSAGLRSCCIWRDSDVGQRRSRPSASSSATANDPTIGDNLTLRSSVRLSCAIR